MDFGLGIGIGAGLGLLVAVLAIAGVLVWRQRGNPAARSETPVLAAPAPAAEAAINPPSSLRGRLETLYRDGRGQEIPQLLDRTLPEWLVSASLIEAARELMALDEAITLARAHGVTEEVAGRLTGQAATVRGDLWSLAERIATADQMGTRALRADLEQHDESLVRLLSGMREAREGLAELSLSGVAGLTDLRAAEGRFRSLGATARELHEWEREQTPW